MSDRTFSFFLVLFGLGYGYLSLQFEVPFVYDPLGPRPFPLFLSALLSLAALVLLLAPRSGGDGETPTGSPRQVLKLIVILFFYQLSWSLLGFLLSTTISLYLAARLFRCSWMQGLMTALVLTVICYGLFNFVLGTPLPLGAIFAAAGG